MKHLINANKSVTVAALLNKTESLILFKGNSQMGSSGGADYYIFIKQKYLK